MKTSFPALLLFATLATLTFSVAAAADETAPSPAPPLLLHRHVNAGLACNACHKEDPPQTPVQTATCEGCHGSYEKLAEKTLEVSPNPHASHWGQLDCASCHHMHKPSEDFCAKCHQFGFKVP